MTIKKTTITILAFIISLTLLSQTAPIKLMQYNLLCYDIYTYYCSESNNPLMVKEANLRTIIEYVKPDILCVNELGASNASADRLLDSVLNRNGINYYQRGNMTNYSGSNEINMIYFNSEKLGISKQFGLATDRRDLSFYKMYYKDPELDANSDTTDFYCIITHLKSSSSQSDQDARAYETQILMNYLNNVGNADNYIFSGDFNLYTDQEVAYQNLINHANPLIRFYDPIDKSGSWSNNYLFTDYHTQSTHYSTEGCFASGGLDDRFDFILISKNILDGTDKVSYVPDSYLTFGQDGAHFNQAVNSLVNLSIPENIANALYATSDHLPVIIQLELETLNISENQSYQEDLMVTTPVISNNSIIFSVSMRKERMLRISIYNTTGANVFSETYPAQNKINCIIDINKLNSGIYLLHVTDMLDNQKLIRFFK